MVAIFNSINQLSNFYDLTWWLMQQRKVTHLTQLSGMTSPSFNIALYYAPTMMSLLVLAFQYFILFLSAFSFYSPYYNVTI